MGKPLPAARLPAGRGSPALGLRCARADPLLQLAGLGLADPLLDLFFDHLQRLALERTQQERHVEIETDVLVADIERPLERDALPLEADVGAVLVLPLTSRVVRREAIAI